MLSMIFDIIVPRWPLGSGRGRPQPVPADGFYLLVVVINVAIVVLISGAIAQARKRGAAITRDLASHLWARGGKARASVAGCLALPGRRNPFQWGSKAGTTSRPDARPV